MVFRVDRQGFFVALATIAACGAPSPPPVLTVVSVPVQPNDPTMPVAPPSSTATAPPTMSTPIASATPGPSDEGGAPTSEGGGPADEGAGDDDAMCRAKAVKRPVACADDRGTPADCKKGNCALGFVCDQCEAYKRYFKPKIAERAVACVIGQTRKQAQDGCRTYQCGDEALKGACIDTTADAECKSIATKCKTTVSECRGMLSGMNGAGRALIASCAAKGCPYGLWSCIEGI
jgi:hypothetical protein